MPTNNFTIRGLGVNASELGFNGLYGLAPDGHVPVEMIERVEVLKGPGALMSGMTPGGAVGGTINLVTKRPLAQDLTRVTTMFSSGSQLGLQADVSRRFGPERRLGIRVNGSTSSGDTEIDGQNRRHGLGALALDYQGDGFTLGLDAYSYRSTIRDGSPMMVSMQNLKQVIAAPDATTNLFPGIHAKQQSDALMLRGSVDLGADWTLFGSAGTAQHAYDGMLNGTRVVLRAQGDGSAVGQTYNQYGYTDSTAAEFGVRGRLRTGGVNHLLVASLNWMNQKGGRAAVATSASYITNIYNPAPITLAGPYGAIKQERDDVLSSLALADTLNWGGDAVQLTVGARLQRVNQKMAGYNEQAVSPALGLVVKPWGDAVSLYANHVQGLSAGSIVGATYANAGEVFAPYKTKQFEIGAKWRTGDFTQTVSLFQIERPSSVVETATNRLLMDGEQRNRGLEWNVFGEPLRGTRVLGGLAYTQAIQSKTQGGARDGFGVYGVPRWTANLGGEWDVPALPGATVTGRLIYTGAQWVNSANTLKMPSWTRVDVGARYATPHRGQNPSPSAPRWRTCSTSPTGPAASTTTSPPRAARARYVSRPRWTSDAMAQAARQGLCLAASLLCLLGAAVHAGEDMTAAASRQALAARPGTLAPGQAATGVLAAGGRESWRVDLPAGHVVQGEFEGQGVALDLEDAQGRHLRRLARPDGGAQSLMWVTEGAGRQRLVARHIATDALMAGEVKSAAGRFALRLTSSLAPLGAKAVQALELPALESPRLQALAQAIQRGAGSGVAADAFWRRVQEEGTPMVEPLPGGQSLVTFLWRGQPRAGMQGVRLFGSPAGNHEPLQHLDGSDVWWASFRMADNARLSYRLAPDVPLIAGSAMEQRRALLATAQRDPLNPKVFPQPPEGGFIDAFQGASVLELPKAPPQPWVAPRAGVAQGALVQHRLSSRVLGNTRDVWTLPPGGRPGARGASGAVRRQRLCEAGVHAHPHRQPHGRRPDPAHGRGAGGQRQPAGARQGVAAQHRLRTLSG